MSNYMPYTAQNQNQAFQPYQATQYFPQPQGSIYMIANANDIANVPVGAGLSAAISLREGVMYLKTIQNGSPMLLGYRLSPLEGAMDSGSDKAASLTCEIDQKITATLEDYGNRLSKIEQILLQKPEQQNEKPKGGISGWQL